MTPSSAAATPVAAAVVGWRTRLIRRGSLICGPRTFDLVRLELRSNIGRSRTGLKIHLAVRPAAARPRPRVAHSTANELGDGD